MSPDFKKADINIPVVQRIDNSDLIEQRSWLTPEHIPVKPVFTLDDLLDMEHLNYAAGIPPYLRGPYSTMYVTQPWTIRQYAGFSTAED